MYESMLIFLGLGLLGAIGLVCWGLLGIMRSQYAEQDIDWDIGDTSRLKGRTGPLQDDNEGGPGNEHGK